MGGGGGGGRGRFCCCSQLHMYSQMKVKVARTVPRPFPGDIRVQRKKHRYQKRIKKVASEFRWKVARMSHLWKRALTLTL